MHKFQGNYPLILGSVIQFSSREYVFFQNNIIAYIFEHKEALFLVDRSEVRQEFTSGMSIYSIL